MDVIREENHPDLDELRTDPAELVWHLYRHHGLDINELPHTDPSALWDLHETHHRAP